MHIVTDYIFFILFAHTGVRSQNIHQQGVMLEFCNLDSFRPECWKNEAIVIDEAYYGRRHIGKCIQEKDVSRALANDTLYLGCSANVVDQLHGKCSGKRQCEVRVPDGDLEVTKPCMEDLKMFLEVSYHCVEVVQDRSCVVTLTSRTLHIASSSSRQSNINCGTKTQPWLLEAPAGQRINISLLDFTDSENLTWSASHINSSISDSSCVQQQKHQYGYIIDKSSVNKKNMFVCGADSNRQTHVYLSTSNQLQLVLTATQQQQVNYLFKVEAVGCTNLIPPEDTWLKRDDDNITIGCYTSPQMWQLRCLDGEWKGVVSNCSLPPNITEDTSLSRYEIASSTSHNQVMVIMGVCFVGITACLMILCCGVTCLRRSYYQYSPTNIPEKSGIKYNYIQPDDLNQHNVRMSTVGQINLHNNRPLSQQQPAAQPQYSVFVGTNDDRRDVIHYDDVTINRMAAATDVDYFVPDPDSDDVTSAET